MTNLSCDKLHSLHFHESESDSRSVLSDSLRPHGLHSSWNTPGQNTGMDSCSLLQGIFLTQESNRGLLHCRWILYQLSYQGSLDNMLKSSDITLLTKVCIAKAMVFPLVIHGCESWTIKKTENGCFWIAVLEKILESSLDCKEIKPAHPKGNQYWVFIGRTSAEAETPIVWPPDERADSLGKTLMLGKTEGWRRRGQQRMRSLDPILDWMDMSLSKLWEIVKVCCSPWSHKEPDMT